MKITSAKMSSPIRILTIMIQNGIPLTVSLETWILTCLEEKYSTYSKYAHICKHT